MRRATRAIDEAVRNVEGLAPVHVVRDSAPLWCLGQTLFWIWCTTLREREERRARAIHHGRRRERDDANNKKKNKNTTLVDAKDCGVFRTHEKPLDGLLGKLREILGRLMMMMMMMMMTNAGRTGAHREEADDDTNATRNRNTTNIRSGIFGYAPKDSEQRTVLFLDACRT